MKNSPDWEATRNAILDLPWNASLDAHELHDLTVRLNGMSYEELLAEQASSYALNG